jgi:hypothetical protein
MTSEEAWPAPPLPLLNAEVAVLPMRVNLSIPLYLEASKYYNHSFISI